YSADQNPQRPRQVSELRCEHRPNQRSRPGDRSKVMSENNPFVRGKKIPPVLQALRRSGSLRIKPKNFSRDELAVKAISERVGAHRRGYQPERIDLLPAMKRDSAKSETAEEGNEDPNNKSAAGFHN